MGKGGRGGGHPLAHENHSLDTTPSTHNDEAAEKKFPYKDGIT